MLNSKILELCKEIGIYTFADLQLFKKYEQGNDTLLDALINYRQSLGANFCVKY